MSYYFAFVRQVFFQINDQKFFSVGIWSSPDVSQLQVVWRARMTSIIIYETMSHKPVCRTTVTCGLKHERIAERLAIYILASVPLLQTSTGRTSTNHGIIACRGGTGC